MSDGDAGAKTSQTAAAIQDPWPGAAGPARGPAVPGGPRRDGGPSFFFDLFGVLAGPAAFWRRRAAAAPAPSRSVWLHLLVLIGLRCVAGFGGALLRGAGLGASLGQFFSALLASFVMVWLFAAIVAFLSAGAAGRATIRDSFRYAAYGLTPLFVIGILAVIPLPYVSAIADLVMMPYTFYVLAAGVVPALGVTEDRAPTRVGLICGALLFLWSTMPTLIPLVVESLVK
jgi:hypothetical protein